MPTTPKKPTSRTNWNSADRFYIDCRAGSTSPAVRKGSQLTVEEARAVAEVLSNTNWSVEIRNEITTHLFRPGVDT